MATKEQIATVMESAINEAIQHLGFPSPEEANTRLHKRFLEAQAKHYAELEQLKNIEPIPIQIAKAIQAAQSGGGNDTKPTKGNIAGNTRAALLTSWNDYKSQPDNFTPHPIIRKKGEKPTYEEFIKYCGGLIIAHGKTLKTILEEARNPNESPKETLARLVKNEQANRRRNST